MPIELHCNHCGKLVRAPEDAGGKHGKCPSCHQDVYIPTPSDALEPLNISPLDPNAERERARLRHETNVVAARLSSERDPGDGPRGAAAGARPAPTPTLTAHEIEEHVMDYCAAMAGGDLTRAEAIATAARRQPKMLDDVINRIIADELPPAQLAKIPRPVLNGFLKQLRGR